jgi:hypothetical protein
MLCLSQPESALHLLATCTISIRLWRRILNSANLLANLTPNTGTTQLQDLLEETCHALPLANQKAWTSLVHLTWWNIKKERNTRIFRNNAAALSHVHAGIIEEAKSWRDARRCKAFDLLHRPQEPD